MQFLKVGWHSLRPWRCLHPLRQQMLYPRMRTVAIYSFTTLLLRWQPLQQTLLQSHRLPAMLMMCSGYQSGC